MAKAISRPSAIPAHPKDSRTYTRFSLSQRIEHIVLLVTFTTLGLTGLVQKYSTAAVSDAIIGFLGGIEATRLIHRGAAIGLMGVSIYHIIAVLYRVIVKRASLNMLPDLSDFRHLFQDIQFYLGRRARKAYYGRYNYAEKAEYLAVVWGTVIMAITGFMMWNPISTTRFLPGEAIPAAKAAHGGEALLAVLAIILWHFYHVHLRRFNKSMFTGKLNREEMEEDHPAELAQIESGTAAAPAPANLRQRQLVFFPVAILLAGALSLGLYQFASFEQTALSQAPQGETAPIFVPFTPTPTSLPTATPLPTATSTPPPPGATAAPAGPAAQAAASWEGGIGELLSQRCGGCHGAGGGMGGLSLASYADAFKGGSRGPAIIPGNPTDSALVQIQSAGGHPGQLTPEELALVTAWVEAGAPEK
jgi:cytochrome b subunit of formate dehydrogenase/mono/diheme cytochrome c family protein